MSFQGFFETAKKKRKARDSSPGRHDPRPSDQGRSQPRYPARTLAPTSVERGQKRKPKASTTNAEVPRNKRRRRQPVSPAALALSAQLQVLSRQKRLEEVLKLYWDDRSGERDVHHACMVIDCCARCGHVAEAERVFRAAARRDDGSVEMRTAMLKAYAHAGQIHEAEQLFASMCDANSRVVPNVRTLNTLLRGCLWSATCLHDGSLVGGVITSERAWELYRTKVGENSVDASSYEYSISLLCQALRVQDASSRLQEFLDRNQIHIKGKASFRGGDETAMETLAAGYLCLARAYAFQGQWQDTWVACQRVLGAIEGCKGRRLLDNDKTPAGPAGKQTNGGKRSWKDEKAASVQRNASNQSFRSHRLSEFEREARIILKMRGEMTNEVTPAWLSLKVLTRLFYFYGGGTTEIVNNRVEAKTDRKEQQLRLLVPVWYSYGLSILASGKEAQVPREDLPDPKAVYEFVCQKKLLKKMIDKEGRLDFDGIFTEKCHPLDVELGSGFGEWIAAQAQANRKRNFIAVELRADRVSHIFNKSVLELRLDNVCVVGSDGGSFLTKHVPSSRVSTIYVNHPEPPTQTFGDNVADLNSIMSGGPEPAHMLCSSTLVAAASALRSDGKIVIISDNRWYSRLICATFVKALRLHKCGLVSLTANEAKSSGLCLAESFEDTTYLYQSLPRSSGSNGATWFDRLWQTGAGKHAEQKIRYAIVMKKK